MTDSSFLAVGRQLALWALAQVYGKAGEYSGPLYKSVEQQNGKLVVHFDHADGLAAARGAKLDGFAIAGADQHFVWADARIVGSTVEVSSAQVPQPVAVRYAWAANPRGNLVNAAGLPASPFRSDDWKMKLAPPPKKDRRPKNR